MCNFRFLLLLVCVVLLNSCSKYPVDVERALKLAGNNRIELEKVLKCYLQNPGDSLKYKAACFLIENMPYHFEIQSSAMDSLRVCLKTSKEYSKIKETYEQLLLNNSDEFKNDLEYIKADYLIKNIDYSFKVWKTSPWGNNISFESFCNDILPYRVADEPLEDWKESYYAFFSPLIDSIKNKNDLKEV